MQVILHTGAHCTDDDRLLKCLLRNAGDWRHEGIAVPGPGKYRQLLSELANNLPGMSLGEDARDVVLDAILAEDPEQVKRLVLSHENFFSVPKLLLGGGRMYRKAETRVRILCDLFAGDQVEIFLGMRNPATFLPAVYAATPHEDFTTFLNGVDPAHVQWSDLIRRLRMDVPEVAITVWCNEDTPLIWGQILRDMAGVEASRKITGSFDLFSSIINPEGMKRFRAFLKEHPNINEMQKRRVMLAFLDKYALDEEIEEELDLPGWSEDYVEMLTEMYEDDIDTLADIPCVRLITP